LNHVRQMIERFDKPEYIYRPRQALRRVYQAVRPQPPLVEVDLPWGLSISVRPSSVMGRAVWCMGVYDLPLTEAVWRLLDPGETAIDVGANHGYVTSIMAARGGPNGQVVAFEPHPQNFGMLCSNVARWARSSVASITPFSIALSAKSGCGYLEEPPGFEDNCGLARIAENSPDSQQKLISVLTSRLDENVGAGVSVGVLKIDVEGHELDVLSGCRGLLQKGSIRDILFEEHSRSFSSAVPSFLEAFGYRIFAVTRELTGPILVPGGQPARFVPYLPPNFLATRDPKRAAARFQRRGWQALQAQLSTGDQSRCC
jgi:FkbM family methyltransferase